MPRNRFMYTEEDIKSLRFEPPKSDARKRAEAIGKKIKDKYVKEEKPK